MAQTKVQARLVEDGVPLGDSILWSWIRDYYARGGVEVWSNGDIPFHITNTPVLAEEWARSVITLLRDFARHQTLDPERPVEVFELGPGTGRHAYFLYSELKRLEPLTQVFCPRGGLRFRLHLAELGQAGLQSLADHSHWQEALAQGDLVLHQFDIDSDESPRLFHPADGSLDLPSPNPVFVICNYLLDSLPHDVLRVRDGQLQKGLTQVRVKGLKKGADPGELADLGERIQLKFKFAEQDTLYPQSHWNEVAAVYKKMRVETHVPFPTSALRLADRARQWSQIATCFLVADKSFTALEQMQELEVPELVPHGGGFSFNANLHAFGLLADAMGGRYHHTPSRDGTLDLSHAIFPAPDYDADGWKFLETEYRFRELEKFHAVDRFRTKESVDELTETYPLRLCLDLLRLGGFDPQIFYELSDNILRGLDKNCEELPDMEIELAEALPICLEMVYPLPDDVDAAFEIGRVAYRLEAYRLAHHAFTLSLEQYGDDSRTRFNLGLSWYYREQWEKAKIEFQRAIQLDPKYQDARVWKVKTDNKLKALSTTSAG